MQGALTPAHTLSIRLYLKRILFSPFSQSILFVCTFPLTLMDISYFLRACLHGGGGPQIGEVTSGGHPTYHVNVIKLI